MNLLVVIYLLALCCIVLTNHMSTREGIDKVSNNLRDINECLDNIESQLLKINCEHERTEVIKISGFVVVRCSICDKELGKYDSYEHAQQGLNNE